MNSSIIQPANTARAVPESRTVLHLSDLHFGWRFNGSNWADVKIEARKVAPDLVIVTGDLVNTPWFWMWRRAKRELTTFIRDLRRQTGKVALPLRIIPGNHDTRISGIYPVPWLLPTALACAAVAAVCYWLYGTATGTRWLALLLQGVGWTAVTLTAVAIALRGLVRRDMRHAIGEEFWLTDATLFPELALGIVGFDSASTRLSWARGHVTPANIVQGKNAMLREEAKLRQGDRQPVWMAAVHHHPLPLPYDSASEHMMVMDNAGAFLRELARRNIKLILHGHKHHQHFARIAVDPATAQRLEIAVLSAGTPTQGSTSGVFRHGFNVIRVLADDRLEVEMFEAEPEGGTFCSARRFDVVPSEDHARDRFEDRKQRYALWCRRMVCIADINEYGDAHFVREFRGVKSTRERVKEFPSSLPASAYSGLIEGYRVQSLSNHGPGVTFRIDEQKRNEIVSRVLFKGAGLQEGDDPIDFMTEFQGNNAFALNRWQFESMYPREDYLEYVSFRAPEDVAVEELVLHVRFPATTGLPGRLDIRSGRDAATGQVWAPFEPRTLVKLESQNAVEARIMHPVPNTIYQINWDLEEVTPRVEDPAVEHAIGRALALRAWLAEFHNAKPPLELIELLAEAEQWVRGKLVQEPSSDLPLNAALFCYIEFEKRLVTIASNYGPGDARGHWTFPFGLGIPGRAFKSAEITAFDRPYDWKSGRPLGYMFGEEEAQSVPEVALLAFPLAAPEAPDWPYAVWQIGTDHLDVSLHTADTPTDKILEEVNAALQENLMAALESIMQEATQATGKTQP